VLGDAANISIQQLTSEPFDSQSGNEGKVGKLFCGFFKPVPNCWIA